MINTVTFADTTSNIAKRKNGEKIGDYLVVSYEFDKGLQSRIYNLISGKFAIPVQFQNITDAGAVATWLDEQYNEYLPIWEVYPEADVFSLAKWSVKDGLRIIEALDKLKNREVTAQDVFNLVESIDDTNLRSYLRRFS